MIPKFKLGDIVTTGEHTYMVKSIVIEEEYNSILYNSFKHYTNTDDLSFYESELKLVKEDNES